MPRAMNVASSSQLAAFAASASDGMGVAVLGVALDQSKSSAAQLLNGLSQKDGSGQLVDLYA